MNEKQTTLVRILETTTPYKFRIEGFKVTQVRERGEIGLATLTSENELTAFLMGYCVGVLGDNLSYYLNIPGDGVEFFHAPGVPTWD